MCLLTLLAFAFSTVFHLTLSSSIILVWKAWQISFELHIFIYSVWNYESTHFWKYTPYGYMYFFKYSQTWSCSLAIIVYFVKILILCTGDCYLFICVFLFPFPSILFSLSMINIQFETHFYVLCTKFCKPLPPLLFLFLFLPVCMVETLRAGLMRSQEQTSTTSPQKPKDSEDPGFLGCYAGKWSQCTPWKIFTSQHIIISQKTGILSSFFSVADLEDCIFVTKLDAD